MLLTGIIDFKNNTQEDGHKGTFSLNFILPYRLRRRGKLKLKYFGWFQGIYLDGSPPPVVDVIDQAQEDVYALQHTPDAIAVSFSSHGEDLMGDNVTLEYVRKPSNVFEENNQSHLLFLRNVGAMPFEEAGGIPHKNMELEVPRAYWAMSGHNSVYDLEVCDLEESISEITANFDFINDKKFFTSSDLTRLDSLTITLELIE